MAIAHTQLGTAGDFFWLCRMFPNSVLRCHFQSPAHTPCDGLFPSRKSFFGPLRLSCCLPPFHTHSIFSGYFTMVLFHSFLYFLCRNLLDLTNFSSLETEACPTWRGKPTGVLSAVESFHTCAPGLWAERSYCPLVLWELKYLGRGCVTPTPLRFTA